MKNVTCVTTVVFKKHSHFILWGTGICSIFSCNNKLYVFKKFEYVLLWRDEKGFSVSLIYWLAELICYLYISMLWGGHHDD